MYFKLEVQDNNPLLQFGNKVWGPFGKWNLTPENRMNMELPHDGWYWFDSREEALEYFKLEDVIIDGFPRTVFKNEQV